MAKSFYIIDGHAQIYRAYFAPFRDLSSPSGEPTPYWRHIPPALFRSGKGL